MRKHCGRRTRIGHRSGGLIVAQTEVAGGVGNQTPVPVPGRRQTFYGCLTATWTGSLVSNFPLHGDSFFFMRDELFWGGVMWVL